MPKQHTVSVTWFDTCYLDYLLDHRGIIVGIERSGQTRDELVEQVVDEIYSHDDFDACGDHVHRLLREAVVTAIPSEDPNWRLWPVDGHGDEIQDLDSEEIPEEQPSAWFRCELTSEPLLISLHNNIDEDDGSVMVDCADGGAAGDDGYIDGSTWEFLEDGSVYTILSDRKTLVEELIVEGYEVNCSEYSPPEPVAAQRGPALVAWVTWGSVRGEGPTRATQEQAQRDARADAHGCRRQGGYSDRQVYGVDEEGWARTTDGGYVWPYGRGSRALQVDLTGILAQAVRS